MTDYDVIVVGGGPAGASAAVELAGRGVNVLLLEKEKLPRDKPCAGVLPPRITRLIGRMPEDIVEREFIGYNVISPGGKSVKSEFHKPGFIVDRKKFDYFLLEKAREAGAKVFDKTRVTQVLAGDEIRVIADDKTLTSKFVVAADGVGSLTRSRLGLQEHEKTDLALGVQYEVELSEKEVCERLNDYFEVHYTGVVDEGYGWISPQKKTLKVGLGSTSSEYKKNPRKRLDAFMQHEFVKDKVAGGKTTAFTAHNIPLGGPLEKLRHKNIYFVGDAAGFVWPMTGEGIYSAILSGRVAAQAIDDGACYEGLLKKRGLLRLKNQVKDRQILENKESMLEYVGGLERLSGLQN